MLRTVICRQRDIFLHCVACLRRQQEQNAIHFPPTQTWVLYNRKSGSARKQTRINQRHVLEKIRQLNVNLKFPQGVHVLMITNAKYDTFSSCANQ